MYASLLADLMHRNNVHKLQGQRIYIEEDLCLSCRSAGQEECERKSSVSVCVREEEGRVIFPMVPSKEGSGPGEAV